MDNIAGWISITASIAIAIYVIYQHNKPKVDGNIITILGKFSIPHTVFPLIAWIIFILMWWIAEPSISRYYFHNPYFWMFQILLWINAGGFLQQKEAIEWFVTITIYSVLVIILYIFFWSGTSIKGHNWKKDKISEIDYITDQKRITQAQREQKLAQSEIKIEKQLKNIKEQIKKDPFDPNISKVFANIVADQNTIHRSAIKQIRKDSLLSLKPGTVLKEITKEIPANQIINTGIIATPEQIQKGVSCFLTQMNKPKIYWFVNEIGKDIKITTLTGKIDLFAPGEIILKGGKKEETKVKIQIIYTGVKHPKTQNREAKTSRFFLYKINFIQALLLL